jgi:lipopolysaccharide export system protein LptA
VNGASAGAGEPTHILADRADLEHASGIATFHGKPVRLWQGGNQVQAPAIEFSRAQKRLIARAEASTGWSGAVQPAQVHTVLMRAGGDGTAGVEAQPGAAARCGPAKAATGKSGAEQSQDVVRIASGGLVYSDLLRQADFTGGFRAETVDGTIRASQATVYLQPGGAEQEGSAGSAKSVPPVASAEADSGAVPSLAGHVDRIVATGQVAIEQPGLRATGERLVYTADDQAGVLTGERGAPPRATDAQGTTTTGAALRFQNSCEAGGGVSVEALGEVPGAPAQRVRTESRVRNEGKKEKGKQ